MAELRYSSTAVVVRNALLGNQLTLHLRARIHRAMSGVFWSYKTTPARRSLNVSFANMNRNKIIEVRDFIIATRGKEVWYIDHANRTWKGFIRTEAHDFVHQAVRNNQFSLEIEVKVDT